MAASESEALVPKEDKEKDDDDGFTGCSPNLACNPRARLHRFIVLIFMCLLSFGSYFCYDNPAALQQKIQDDMGVSASQYVNLYALYSWPNVVLCFFGGFLIDRVFGVRWGAIIFALFVAAGQVVFALGALIDQYVVMEIGRFIFGIGGESLCVAQNNYAVFWFKGRELNMVFGLQLSFSRVGSTVNFNIMKPIYDAVKSAIGDPAYRVLGATLMVGVGLCAFSVACAIILAFFDKRAERILNKKKGETSESEKIRMKDVKDFPITVWLIFLICVAYYVAIFPFIGLGTVFFSTKFGFADSQANAVDSIVYLISAGASPLFGFIVDRTGYNIFWVALSCLVTLCSHAMLAFTFWNPWIAMVLMGLSYSMLACALWPMVAFVVPEHQLGTAYGLMQAVQNLGLAVVSMAAGYILDAKGYLVLEMFFLAWLCVAVASSVLLYVFDLSRGGTLNFSVKERKAYDEAKKLKQSKKDLLKDQPHDTSEYTSPIRPRSAKMLRNRYYSILGTNIPDETYASAHKSALAYPRPTK
ncbi:major facilitator superfamily domain-containing protein 1-like [Oscarella lobularis]|uniref:major facilitator superfamily domain-containing protein 1-like n=1 Tax=Oscarella lobularis TaxID=121494 RepID=UPI003313DA0F